MTERPPQFLIREATGGFRLMAGVRPEIEAVREGDGWSVWEPARDGPLRLIRGGAVGCRLRLLAPDDRELGRATAFESSSGATCAAWLVLDDGRVFSVAARVGRDPRFELSGWEVPGAYLVARPVAEGFRIDSTAAGGLLAGPSVITILFSAVILVLLDED